MQNSTPKSPPTVLIFSATDGSGGAGALCDYHAAHAARCLPLFVITAITAQNLDEVQGYWRCSVPQIKQQLGCFSQVSPQAIKVGVIGWAAPTIAAWQKQRGTPLVWDPVLSPTHGAPFSDKKQWANLQQKFLPQVTIATPNRGELLQFSGEKTVSRAVKKWLGWGVQHLLVTDIDGSGKTIRHALFGKSPTLPDWEGSCHRRPFTVHGSGCYFSTYLAGQLARQTPLTTAIERTQQQTEQQIDTALSLPTLGKQRLICPVT